MRIRPHFCWLLLLVASAGIARAQSSEAPSLPHTTLGEEPVRANLGGPSSNGPVPAGSAGAAQSHGTDYTRVLAALGGVIGLIFALRWASRFVFPAAVGRAGGKVIEVVSRSALSPKQQVMLLRVGRRLLVVGDSGGQMSSLCEITDPDEVASLVGQLRDETRVPGSKAFGAMFGRSRQPFESGEVPASEESTELREADADPTSIGTAQEELSGLRDRVRLLAEQFKN